MGGLLGGGSSINFMMYTRAQGVDFDSWETEGWSAKDMLPLCNKLETYHPKDSAIDQSKHGHDGLIHISDGGYRGQSENQFMETVKGMGYNTIVDLQDLEANGGFSVRPLSLVVKLANEIRNGIDTLDLMGSVKTLLTDTSTLYWRTVSIPTSISSSNQKSSAFFLTSHLRQEL